jgi:hypothetical protein
MKNIFVTKQARVVKKKEKIEKELLFYDHEKHKLLKFNGGNLVFEYGYDEELDKYRLIPKASESFEVKETTIVDNDLAKNWFEIYASYNNTTAEQTSQGDEGITFTVSDEEFESFTDDLERQNIKFQII